MFTKICHWSVIIVSDLETQENIGHCEKIRGKKSDNIREL